MSLQSIISRAPAMSFQSVISRTSTMSVQRVISRILAEPFQHVVTKAPAQPFIRVISGTSHMSLHRVISKTPVISFQRFISKTPAMPFHRVISKSPVLSFQRFISKTPAKKFRKFEPEGHLKQFPIISRVVPVLLKIKWRRWLPLSGTVFGISTTLHYYYWRKLKKNPITGRKQFLPLTDQELFDFTNAMAESVLADDKVKVETRRDATGKALDVRTQRLDRIVNTLIEKNPELTTMLLPTVKWQPMVIEHSNQLKGSASSANSGHVFVAGDVMDIFPNDDEVAQLVAHEMSHIILQHSNEEFGRNLFLYQFFLSVLKRLATINPGLDVGHYIKTISKHIGAPDQFLIESEADKVGFMFAAKACYDYRRFGDLLPAMSRYFKEMDAAADARMSRLTNNDEFEDDLFEELQKSNIYFKILHPDNEQRTAALRSNEYMRNARKWRRDAGCIPAVLPSDPVEAVQTLSQKVDELNASRKAKLQNQVNNDKVGQTQVEKQHQDSQNQIEQKQIEQNKDQPTRI